MPGGSRVQVAQPTQSDDDPTQLPSSGFRSQRQALVGFRHPARKRGSLRKPLAARKRVAIESAVSMKRKREKYECVYQPLHDRWGHGGGSV